MHWNHEPTPVPSQEGSSTARPVPLLGGGRGGFIADKFIETARLGGSPVLIDQIDAIAEIGTSARARSSREEPLRVPDDSHRERRGKKRTGRFVLRSKAAGGRL